MCIYMYVYSHIIFSLFPVSLEYVVSQAFPISMEKESGVEVEACFMLQFFCLYVIICEGGSLGALLLYYNLKT